LEAWIAFGVFLIGGYAYWLYTDLIRPKLVDEATPEEWERFDDE
jgi:hypothetical protein